MKPPGQVLGGSTQTSWVLFVDSQASASQCWHLTLCIEAVLGILVNLMQRTREFSSSGAVLCKPSSRASWEGRLTHLSSPGGPPPSAATFPGPYLKSQPGLALPMPPVVPPRVLPSQGIDWGSLFQSLCLGKVAEFSK